MKKLLAILAAALALSGCSQIDTGNVGVTSTFGQVKTEVLQPGFQFTGFASVIEVCGKEVPISIADLKPQTADKITLADLDVDIYVQIDTSKAAIIRTKWTNDVTPLKGADCDVLGQNFIVRQAREVIYDVASKIGSGTIHTERTRIAGETVKALQANLDSEAGKGMFFVRSANVRNIVTDPALEANIKAAAQEQFKLQEEEGRKKRGAVEADRKRIEAQGEADAIRIKAEAVAKQGGSEYVQLQAIAKWNGVLPQTNAGGAVPFLQVK